MYMLRISIATIQVSSRTMCSTSDVEIFRDWLKKQKHLVQEVDDWVIQTYINASKGSLQIAKIKYEKHRMNIHKFYSILDPKFAKNPFGYKHQERLLFENMLMQKLPTKAADGSSILFAKTLSPIDDEDHIHHFILIFIFVIECLLKENDLQDGKVTYIYDMEHVSLSHVKKVTPDLVKKGVSIIQGGVPVRVASMMCVNVPKVAEYTIQITKLFLPQKLKQRVYIFSEIENSYQVIPQSQLPADYGGEAPSIAELFEQQKKMFQKHERELSNIWEKIEFEKQHVPLEWKAEDQFTFKKLEVD